MDLTPAFLKHKEEQLDLWGKNTNLAFRVHRANIWIERAERESDDPLDVPTEQLQGAAGRANPLAGDPDAKFVFYWVAFNALYAEDTEVYSEKTEQENFTSYLRTIVGLDKERAIYNAIWASFHDAPAGLLHNRYVFRDFWKHHNEVPGFANWHMLFTKQWDSAQASFRRRDGFPVLRMLFERLYVLRNQLLHGGATWKGSANRDQVKDGASLLAVLLPIFVNLMMDHPDVRLGKPYFPYIPE